MPYADPEKKRAASRKWALKEYYRLLSEDPERLAKRRAQIKESVRRWRAAHPAEAKASDAANYAKHKPRHQAYGRRKRLEKYGLSPEKFEQMKAEQEGKCAICARTLMPGKGTHVDHDHVTLKVRGMLCLTCNVLLGHLEKPGFLKKVELYLGRLP